MPEEQNDPRILHQDHLISHPVNIIMAWWICTGIHLAGTWDINFPENGCKRTDECSEVVSVNGRLYNKWDVNYVLFGKISSLCDICAVQMHAMIAAHKIVMKPNIQLINNLFGDGRDGFEWEWKYSLHQWAMIGRDFDGHLPNLIPEDNSNQFNCKICEEAYSDAMQTTWP